MGPDPLALVDSYVRVFLLPDKSTNMQTRVSFTVYLYLFVCLFLSIQVQDYSYTQAHSVSITTQLRETQSLLTSCVLLSFSLYDCLNVFTFLFNSQQSLPPPFLHTIYLPAFYLSSSLLSFLPAIHSHQSIYFLPPIILLLLLPVLPRLWLFGLPLYIL